MDRLRFDADPDPDPDPLPQFTYAEKSAIFFLLLFTAEPVHIFLSIFQRHRCIIFNILDSLVFCNFVDKSIT